MNSVGKSLILIYTVELCFDIDTLATTYTHCFEIRNQVQKSFHEIEFWCKTESNVFLSKLNFWDQSQTFRIVWASILLFSWIYRKSKVGDKQKNRLKSFHKTRDQEVPRCWVCRCQCKKRSNAEKGTWQFHRKMIHGNHYVILKYYYRVHTP